MRAETWWQKMTFEASCSCAMWEYRRCVPEIRYGVRWFQLGGGRQVQGRGNGADGYVNNVTLGSRTSLSFSKQR